MRKMTQLPRHGSFRQVLLKSRLSYPVSSYSGASMSHVWHMDSEGCSPSVPICGVAGSKWASRRPVRQEAARARPPVQAGVARAVGQGATPGVRWPGRGLCECEDVSRKYLGPKNPALTFE